MRGLLTALFAGLVALAPLASAQAAAPPAPRKRIVLVVDEMLTLRNFPILVAEKLGYLQSPEYQVTTMNIRPDLGIGELLADGRADAGMAFWHHTVEAHAAGVPTSAVVTLGVVPGVKLMLANRLRGQVRNLADLKGRKIVAGGMYSGKTWAANALVEKAGLKPTDYIRLAPEAKDSIAAMLRDGRADLVVAPTPDSIYYEDQGVASVFADLTTVESTRRVLGTLMPSTAVYMPQSKIDADPGAARHLAGAFVRTLAWIRTHTPEQIAALMPEKAIGKDRAAYMRGLREAIGWFQADGRTPPDGAAAELTVLQSFIPKYRPVRVETTFTNRFVDEALGGR
jgi:NitT/TauT family transport system substrate-binding protein